LVDVAHDHGGKENLGKWNGHSIDGGHNLNKFSKSTLLNVYICSESFFNSHF
jgi:hypothetical protein